MSIREMGKRYLGNSPLVRKLMYFFRENPEKAYQICCNTSANIPSEIRQDMIRSLFLYGSAYDEYFYFDFYGHKEKEYRNSFITEGRRFSFYAKLNKYENLHFFDNKQETYQMYSKYYGRDFLYLSRGGLNS